MSKGLHMREVTMYYAEGNNRITALDHVSISVEPGSLLLSLDLLVLVKVHSCLLLGLC